MTQVDFHILQNGGVDQALLYACQLTEKAYLQGHRVYLHSRDSEQQAGLDELLWTFRADSFIPHAALEQAQDEKVVLGHGEQPGDSNDVLINLDTEMPEFFSRFQRVIEIVCQEDEWLKAARRRYKFYNDRGYPLRKHDIPR